MKRARSSEALVKGVLTSGKQVGEVGLRAAESRVAVFARKQVFLAREPPSLLHAVGLLQEPWGVTWRREGIIPKHLHHARTS